MQAHYTLAALAALALAAPSLALAQAASPPADPAPADPAQAAAAAAPAPAAQPAASEPALCTDRPTKGNATCTVPAHDWQLETDLFNGTFVRGGGTQTDVYLFTNPTLKYGLTDRADLEVNIVPYEDIRTKDLASGETESHEGVGDLFVRLKYNLVTTSLGAITVLPYVKAPTAPHDIGNGKWEGGVALPISLSLPQKFTLVFGPEVDDFADADGHGYHLNLVNLVNLSRPVTDHLTLIAELWSDVNFDPLGTVHQYSADVAAAYGFGHNAQVDIGANFGLNRETPDAQVYVGVSKRF